MASHMKTYSNGYLFEWLKINRCLSCVQDWLECHLNSWGYPFRKYLPVRTNAAINFHLLGQQRFSIQNSKVFSLSNSRGFPYAKNPIRFSFSWWFRFSQLSHFCHRAPLFRQSIFQRYCFTDVKIFVVSFTFTAQKLTNKAPKQNFLLDCQVVSNLDTIGLWGIETRTLQSAFISMKP